MGMLSSMEEGEGTWGVCVVKDTSSVWDPMPGRGPTAALGLDLVLSGPDMLPVVLV